MNINAMFLASQIAKTSECTKTKVGACLELMTHDRDYEQTELFLGYNKSPNAPVVCPRVALNMKSFEGYELCDKVCNQQYHAEQMAVENMLSYMTDSLGVSMPVGDDEDLDVYNKYIKENIGDLDFCLGIDLTCYLFGHKIICQKCMDRLKMFGVSNINLCEKESDIFNLSRWYQFELQDNEYIPIIRKDERF